MVYFWIGFLSFLTLFSQAKESNDMKRYSITSCIEENVRIYTLKDAETDAEAEIIPELGNICIGFRRTLSGESIDLIEPPPGIAQVKKRPSGFGIPILFPFPNRVRDGKYSFEGKTYEFEEKTGLGNSIHGLVYTRPWQVESKEASDDGAVLVSRFDMSDFPGLEKQYPFPFELRVTYTLKDGALFFDVDVKNIGNGNMPMGFGIHPYFSAPLFENTDPAECKIRVPASQYWELEDFLPTGKIIDVTRRLDLREGKPFEGMKFDNVLTGLNEEASRCTIDDKPKRVRFVLESDPQFRELVVYTPPGRNAVAIEPYTCTTDAVNLQTQGIDAGLMVLNPGEKFHGEIKMSAEKY